MPHLERVDPALKPWADMFGKSVDRFQKAIDSSLMKFGKRVVNRQLMLQRIADSAIDLYAMAAVLSRVTARIEQAGLDETQAERDIARIFCSAAERRIRRNLSMIRRHEDRSVRRLARHVYKSKGYPFVG